MSFDLFSPIAPPTPSDGTLIFRLEVDGRLPSWNEILGMEHWARYKFKNELAASFLSALQQSGTDSSMRITCAKNSMSTYADTLERYLVMKQVRRTSKRSKGKRAATKKSRSSSRSTNSAPEPQMVVKAEPHIKSIDPTVPRKEWKDSPFD